MNSDQVKGAVDDAAGRIKRQTGEWTGDTQKQAEGAGQQIKGKAEKAWGNVKEAARDANADLHQNQDDQRQDDSRHADPRHADTADHKNH